MSPLSTEDLALFAVVIDAGSLTAAARQLGTSLSSVSRRLAELEERLGCRLIERSTRRLAPTAAGRALYERGSPILADVKALEDELRGEPNATAGTVRVVMPTLLGELVLHSLPELLERFGGLELEWVEDDQPDPGLGTDVDLTIKVGLPSDTAMVARKIASIRGRLAAAPSYVARAGKPKRIEELARHACLRFRGEQLLDRWTLIDRAGRAHEVQVSGPFCSSSSDALKRALEGGVGIGLVAEQVLERRAALGLLTPILPSYRFEDYPLFAIYSPARRQVRRVEIVLDWLKSAIADSGLPP
ncbi:MAG: LysR family transcriptional regulator [Polyangiaceae bacterium]